MPGCISLTNSISQQQSFSFWVKTGLCFVCNIAHSQNHSVVLKLSRMCEQTALDKYYHMGNDEEGYVVYYGFTGTIIQYDGVNKMWNLSISHKPSVTATSKAKFDTIVLGNNEWEVINDEECQDGIEKKLLSLSTCCEQQFTCNSEESLLFVVYCLFIHTDTINTILILQYRNYNTNIDTIHADADTG